MSARPLIPGSPAPNFSLAATSSGREVGPGSGRPLVLVFHAQNAAFAVDRLNREVRERYPSPGELTVASVVDLSLVPVLQALRPHGARDVVPAGGGFFTTRGRPDGLRRVLLADWTGRVTYDYGASGVYLVPVVVAVAGDGTMPGRHSGANLAAATLKLLQTA